MQIGARAGITAGADWRVESAAERLSAARALLTQERRKGLAALDELFRDGSPPAVALDGRYAGELLALNVAPGLTGLATWLAGRWMPWLGKRFDAASEQGDNVFHNNSRGLARVYWPLYRDYRADGPTTYRAFAFRTRIGPGVADPDRIVLKIEYDLPGNPAATVGRVVDELLQIGDGLYLGKAHLQWWWGRWQQVAYFSLAGKAAPAASP